MKQGGEERLDGGRSLRWRWRGGRQRRQIAVEAGAIPPATGVHAPMRSRAIQIWQYLVAAFKLLHRDTRVV